MKAGRPSSRRVGGVRSSKTRVLGTTGERSGGCRPSRVTEGCRAQEGGKECHLLTAVGREEMSVSCWGLRQAAVQMGQRTKDKRRLGERQTSLL